jgi:hypothetical protein
MGNRESQLDPGSITNSVVEKERKSVAGFLRKPSGFLIFMLNKEVLPHAEGYLSYFQLTRPGAEAGRS